MTWILIAACIIKTPVNEKIHRVEHRTFIFDTYKTKKECLKHTKWEDCGAFCVRGFKK